MQLLHAQYLSRMSTEMLIVRVPCKEKKSNVKDEYYRRSSLKKWKNEYSRKMKIRPYRRHINKNVISLRHKATM